MSTLTCRVCGEVKPEDAFAVRKESQRRRTDCRQCNSKARMERARDNPNERARIAQWCAANRDRWLASKRKVQALWVAANTEKQAAMKSAWRKAHPAENAASSMRRYAAKLNATPRWADHEVIAGIYRRAAELTATGIPHEVDHIVPLQSPIVCGLHVPCNLQVIPMRENCAKGNRYWPDMP